MHELIGDIIAIQGVRGIVLISKTGDLLLAHFRQPSQESAVPRELPQLLTALENLREADLVFARGRLFVRQTSALHLVVLTDLFTQADMIRLNCDIVLAELSRLKPKKLKRLFKK